MAAIQMTPEELRGMRKRGAKVPKTPGMEAEEVRRWAIKALAEMVTLTQLDRERVLKHAITVNRAMLRGPRGIKAVEEEADHG